jgi:hypothetical protein
MLAKYSDSHCLYDDVASTLVNFSLDKTLRELASIPQRLHDLC